MKITYYGHSCFLVETSGKKLLFDPFITPNPLASKVKTETIKPDYILLSHAHEDHVADALNIAIKSGSTLISNFEICMYFSEKGISSYHPMNTGGSYFNSSFTVKSVSAVHSSTFSDGSSGGAPGGFVISSSEGIFYFAGDTALTSDMHLIGEEFTLDFAFLPVGDNFTMGTNDAIKASDFIKCNHIIPMHYNTFDLIKIDVGEVKNTFEKAGKKISIFSIGESKTF